MRPTPRKLSSEKELYTVALRALVRCSHSAFEMRTYLDRRADEPAAARRVVAQLVREHFIDDARYALDFARSHANGRRQGRHRITRELRMRGVPDRHIEAAVAQVFSETDEAVLVRKVIERRMRAARGPRDKGPLDNDPVDKRQLERKKMASLYGTLLRAGFDADLIRREVRAAQHANAEELPDAFADPEM